MSAPRGTTASVASALAMVMGEYARWQTLCQSMGMMSPGGASEMLGAAADAEERCAAAFSSLASETRALIERCEEAQAQSQGQGDGNN